MNDSIKELFRTTPYLNELGNQQPVKDVFIDLLEFDKESNINTKINRVKTKIRYLQRLQNEISLRITNKKFDTDSMDFSNKYGAFLSFINTNRDVDTDATLFFDNVNVSLSQALSKISRDTQELQLVNYKLKAYSRYLSSLYADTGLYDTYITELTTI